MAKKLTVLTFGWEFPPHISGGLGTACYGLTKSLIHQGTSILFVVPKARGDEEVSLISGSEVSVPASRRKGGEGTHVLGETMRVFPVASTLRPYTSVTHEPSSLVEEWSYVTATSPSRSQRAASREAVVKYLFSGSYGPNLLEEVARYGEVGGTLADQHNFDVIHAHDWLTFPAGIAAKKQSGKPLLVHVHATEYDRAGSDNTDPRVYSIEKQGLDEADHVIAVSEWTRDILVSRYGVDPEKVSVVHNGVTMASHGSAERPARTGRHMVTFAGRITYQKGPQYFVEAARRVLGKFPDTHFVVAGSGDLLPALVERVAALRLSSNFHFTGFLKGKQLAQVWSVTDVYVMPSVSEPFGITPLEAIGSGVPVIVSRQSGVSEVMPHAIKADFWDIDALASAICSVLQHKSLSKTLRHKSKQTLKEITWDKAARKLNQIYHDVIAKSE